MNKTEITKLFEDVADEELLFLVRGSSPAAPETLREYGRRVLHYARLLHAINSTAQKAARTEANEAFALADAMEAAQGNLIRLAEDAAGLTAANPEIATHDFKEVSLAALKGHDARE